jgi:hypothetical protein
MCHWIPSRFVKTGTLKNESINLPIVLCWLSLSDDFCARPLLLPFLDTTATNLVYKRAIIQAIDELQDFSLRSNLDAIRRHVQACLSPERTWNDTVFLKTLKSLAHNGDIEQCTYLNCGLSPDFKKRRTNSMKALLEKRAQLHPERASQLASHHHHYHHPPHGLDEKEIPVRKQEHAKLKIIPKKIYENLQ